MDAAARRDEGASSRGRGRGSLQARTGNTSTRTPQAGQGSALPPRKARVRVNAARKGAITKTKAAREPARVPAAPADQSEEVPGLSAVSEADAVVAKYEKLLAAIPTMAKQIGKLQLDTEAMAEGLEKRVRSLVDGHRELNDLVDQTPARFSQAASEYVQGLGLRFQGSRDSGDASGRDAPGQVLDVEEIHRELFALKEAKLALDQMVMPSPADLTHRTPDGSSARRGGVGRVGGMTGSIKRGSAISAVATVSAAARGGNRVSRADDVATAAGARVGAGTRRSSERRALAEMQLDPGLPIPLPSFPGLEKLQGGQRLYRNIPQQLEHRAAGNLPDDLKHIDNGGETGAAERPYHGYFVPGVVAPRQRQSHGLPHELRAISTIPTREKRPISRTTASSGQRRRVRSKSSAAASSRRTSPAPLPAPPAEGKAAGDSGSRSGGVPSIRPEPGSAAALAIAREQRRFTSQVVNELRKEMRERERRLEQKLDMLRHSRSQHVTPAAPAPDTRSAQSAAPTSAIGRKHGIAVRHASRDKGRPMSRVPASNQRSAASRNAVGEEMAGQGHDEGDGGSRPVVRPVETADAQAQTATNGVQILLQPQPAIRHVLQPAEDQPSPKEAPAVVRRAQAQQTGISAGSVDGEDYFDDASFASFSVSGEDAGLRCQLGGRRVSPPAPVVFIEGEGRNLSWRPSDDDRLLGRGGDVVGINSTQSARTKVMSEAFNGGDARLILAAAGADLVEERGNQEEEKEEEANRKHTQEIRVTTGRVEAAAPESEDVGAEMQEDVWVELAGMLALSASKSTVGLSPAAATAGTPVAQDASKPVTDTPAAASELLDLMREVVGQQRELGEERSALMKALRAEMDCRRTLLANQELSLRERELALKRNEAESGGGAEPATLRLATAAAAAAAAAAAYASDADMKKKVQERADQDGITTQRVEEGQQTARASTAQRFWPITSEHEDVESGGSGAELNLKRGEPGTAEHEHEGVVARGAASRENGDGDDTSQQQPLQSFRSSLGRMLAAGSGWRDLPLEEGFGAPRRVFVTSLGRALAGGPALEQLRLFGERQPTQGGDPYTFQGMVGVRDDATLGSSRTGTGHAAGEFDVQELLWEAGRTGVRGGDTGTVSPETAVRKRASSLESRRFLEAMSVSEAKRHAIGGEEGLPSPEGGCDGESELEASAEDTRTQAAREGRNPNPPPPLPLVQTDVSSTAKQQQQQQRQLQDEGHGRLHLSLATAMLSVAQRLRSVEERALARAEGAEDLARQALEETKREGQAWRQRQSDVMIRLEEMEHGSEKRAMGVAREIAELRKEGRLERQRMNQLQQVQSRTPPRKAKIGPPNAPSSSSSNSISGGNRSFLEALSLATASESGTPVRAAHQQPTPSRSESRSSVSEGQLRGSFSDGELVRLTPGGGHSRYALEDGELPPPPPLPPPPVRGQRSEADPLGSTSSAGREWSWGGDPRQYLALLMSAHPRLMRNRAPRLGGGSKTPHPTSAVNVGGRQRGASPRGAFSGTVRRNGERLAKESFPELSENLGDSEGDAGDAGSSPCDSGQSLEPGQARLSMRRSWPGGNPRANTTGLGTRSRGGGQVGLGPLWLRQPQSETASSEGEASSGAEVGENLHVFSDEDVDGFFGDGGGKGGERASRPLAPLKIEAGSSVRQRRRKTEIQRAVAEAELEMCTTAPLAGDLIELTVEHRGREEVGVDMGMEGADTATASGERDGDVGADELDGVGEGTESTGFFPPEQKEPGEVPP